MKVFLKCMMKGVVGAGLAGFGLFLMDKAVEEVARKF